MPPTKKVGKSSYGTEEWRRSQEENMFGPTTAARRGNAANYAKDTRNLSSKGYPSSTNPTSQPKTKKTIGTLEAKEKAKTRSVLEKVFKENTIKAAPPSKEEQERMRKQGARNAANMYGKNYSGRRG